MTESAASRHPCQHLGHEPGVRRHLPARRKTVRLGLAIADSMQLPLSILTVERSEKRREEIQQSARRHQPESADRASFEYDTGEPAVAILRRAVPDTLVVMGAYGHSRLYRMVLGSVTEQVMRAARGPLLLSRK